MQFIKIITLMTLKKVKFINFCIFNEFFRAIPEYRSNNH